MKLYHRKYLDLNEGFPTMQDSNQPTQLQRLARMLNFAWSKSINYTFIPGSEQQSRWSDYADV